MTFETFVQKIDDFQQNDFELTGAYFSFHGAVVAHTRPVRNFRVSQFWHAKSSLFDADTCLDDDGPGSLV